MISAALLQLADRPPGARCSAAAPRGGRSRTWATSMAELAAGYDELLAPTRGRGEIGVHMAQAA